MKKRVFLIAAITYFVVSGSFAFSRTDTLNVTHFGNAYIYKKGESPANQTIMYSGEAWWKAPGDFDKVKNLPLILTATRSQNNHSDMALLISGDGGWYGFEQSIADNLAALGIPTIGVDSKKYFWKRKTPEETASDIEKALIYYGEKWGRDRYVLIGYSLGGEIVPYIANRLSLSVKPGIESLVLLSPAVTTDFEIHITNMIGIGNRMNTYNVVDEINKLQIHNIIAIFGEGEKSPVPDLIKNSHVKSIQIPGDHHYKFNVPLIMKTLIDNKAF